jgi:hypothetical protein
MQRVHRPVGGDSPAGRYQCLAGHLPAKYALASFSLRAAAAEDVDLDLLQVEKLDDSV